ncbi:hypothetical protein FPSE_06633 [Fusarium pseudograminearum CS3096]|uniref:ADP-ribosylation factor n=1 Tax=Fusarium pseudograminearum (strain CS3096) TaxID=1028729 RepID=K3VGJ7_FUSPC|nr:hypothetical protein FPSE_06633 [Fusarium pseudograminearum CS3096]EKJ73209.1 hypothetical protein FPSE_06633 [Fusarium pseudograminearum CS3096]
MHMILVKCHRLLVPEIVLPSPSGPRYLNLSAAYCIMGATISQLWTPPMIDIAVVGLPSAGKTAIIHKLSGGQKPTQPLNETVNTTHFSQGSQQYFFFDYSGNEKVRAIWRVFLSRKEALVFVIDSTNRDNMEETKEALWNVLRNIMLDGQPVLILANKQDHPKAMNVLELIECLEIDKDLEKNKNFVRVLFHQSLRIVATSAITGENLVEGLEWMRQVYFQDDIDNNPIQDIQDYK